MGTIDWGAVFAASLAALAVLMLAFRGNPAGWYIRRIPVGALLVFLPAAMLGHALARIGPQTLAAKPQLYAMQSGGLALAFVIPALWLTQLRDGVPRRQTLTDSAAFLAAYLAMGGVFWLFA